MTERELREIKRRFTPEKSNIPRIVGCLVNSNKQIVSKISQSLDFSDSAAAEKLLSVMKKTLTGGIGTRITEISFSTKQVTESAEHKLLSTLRTSRLGDEGALNELYTKIINSLNFEGNYAILLANDVYDVVTHTSDGERGGAAESFSYVVAAICPVKNAPETLSFKETDSLFHIDGSEPTLLSPELGFMFPAFDDRHANIYGALLYTRSATESYGDFVRNIFESEPPMPTVVQKSTFNECLSASLGEDCSLEVVRAIHEQVGEMIEAHKESHIPEPLKITKGTVKTILSSCGIEEEKCDTAAASFEESFGINAEVTPKNIITPTKFTVETADVSIKVNPEKRDLVSTKIINGEEYILIRVTGGVEVNGIFCKGE